MCTRAAVGQLRGVWRQQHSSLCTRREAEANLQGVRGPRYLPCVHGPRRRHRCKDCGGVGICAHGRRRYTCQCTECEGSGICVHGRLRHTCTECGGSSICAHGRRRHTCKECGGVGIQVCAHRDGRRRYTYKECGGVGICAHGREKPLFSKRYCGQCRGLSANKGHRILKVQKERKQQRHLSTQKGTRPLARSDCHCGAVLWDLGDTATCATTCIVRQITVRVAAVRRRPGRPGLGRPPCCQRVAAPELRRARAGAASGRLLVGGPGPRPGGRFPKLSQVVTHREARGPPGGPGPRRTMMPAKKGDRRFTVS